MSVKICGHLIRWHKTIKIYRFWRHAAIALLLCAPLTSPAFADSQKHDIAARLANTAPAAGHPSMPCDMQVLEKHTRHAKPQQQAAALSPAHILALALGVRTISGPIERGSITAHKTRISSSSFDRRTPLMPQDKGDQPLLSMQTRQPRPMME